MKQVEKLESRRAWIKVLAKFAKKKGIKFIIEPEWGITAQMVFPNGLVRSMQGYLFDLNGVASTGISTDKQHAKFFMKKMGYPVAEGQTFFENKWAKEMQSNRTISYARKYAKDLGYPVIVKPNNRSQGFGVCLVWNERELVSALLDIFKEEKVAIVERYMPGKDYRVVVLDGKVISAYERVPLSVVGDGKNSILALLKKKQNSTSFRRRGIKVNFKDNRIKMKLKRQGLTFRSIPRHGKQILLLDNSNLSSGGEAVDATNIIHPGFLKIALDLTKNMGLRFCGIDIMLTKGDISGNPDDKKECRYYIIETNASPGLITHYLKDPIEQKKLSDIMDLEILKALGKKD